MVLFNAVVSAIRRALRKTPGQPDSSLQQRQQWLQVSQMVYFNVLQAAST